MIKSTCYFIGSRRYEWNGTLRNKTRRFNRLVHYISYMEANVGLTLVGIFLVVFVFDLHEVVSVYYN